MIKDAATGVAIGVAAEVTEEIVDSFRGDNDIEVDSGGCDFDNY